MSNVQNYRSRYSETEAIQYDGNNPRAIQDFVGIENSHYVPPIDGMDCLYLHTKAGLQRLQPGMYVVRQAYPTGDMDYYGMHEVVFLRSYHLYDKQAKLDEGFRRALLLIMAGITGVSVGLALSLLFIP